MNRIVGIVSLCVLGAVSVGCPADDVDSVPDVGTEEEAIVDDGASTYYIATRRDMRRCAYPMCGGTFVKRVNRALTRCSDGVYRSECYVADLDLSSLGLTGDQRAKYQETFAQRQGIVRGALRRASGGSDVLHDVGALKASEAWVAATSAVPTGTFYGLSDSGILCITSPCPSILEETINDETRRQIHELDLSGSGASDEQMDQAMTFFSTYGILAAGEHETITGPGGTGEKLVASQFYTRLLPAERACGGTFPGNPPCDEGYFCELPAGMCGAADVTGTCKMQSAGCIEIYQPVCGCDGHTYSNDCVRQSAGVSLDHDGMCERI